MIFLAAFTVLASFALVIFVLLQKGAADARADTATRELVTRLEAHGLALAELQKAHQQDRDEWAAAAAAERQELLDRLALTEHQQLEMLRPPAAVYPPNYPPGREPHAGPWGGDGPTWAQTDEDHEQAATEDEDARRAAAAIDEALSERLEALDV